MSKMKHIISLGAGVQSSTMALMAAHGEITPMPDCAIFADTQAEPQSVYTWLDWLEKQLPFPVIRVTQGNLEVDSLQIKISRRTLTSYLRTLIPLFTHTVIRSGQGVLNWGFDEDYEDVEEDREREEAWREPKVKKGILTRKCTGDYKVAPINREIRKQLGLTNKRSPIEPVVTQWIGISTDEASRMKDSKDAWNKMRWPLIEKGMSRSDCIEWMFNHNYPKPPRSACVFCPFHSDSEWRRLKYTEPEEFNRAVQFERKLQNAQLNQDSLLGKPFLHASLKPLDEIDFDNNPRPFERLFGNECEGMCGV